MYIEKREIIYVIVIVGIFILLDGYSKFRSFFNNEADTVEKETITTTNYITKKQLDSIIDFTIGSQYAVPQRIIIKNDIVKPVDNDYKLNEKEVLEGTEIKEVTKYVDTTTLNNGTIYSEIFADKLYGKKFSLATTDTIINKTTLERLHVVKSSLFYGAGTTFGLDGRLKDIEATMNYTHKNKFYIEGGLQYDLDPLIDLSANKRTGIKLKVGFNF